MVLAFHMLVSLCILKLHLFGAQFSCKDCDYLIVSFPPSPFFFNKCFTEILLPLFGFHREFLLIDFLGCSQLFRHFFNCLKKNSCVI